jgi:hypothetical protein
LIFQKFQRLFTRLVATGHLVEGAAKLAGVDEGAFDEFVLGLGRPRRRGALRIDLLVSHLLSPGGVKMKTLWSHHVPNGPQ